jgi:hypothetical protein
MSKVASSKNLEVRLSAYLIGHLAAEGVCIGAHKTLIFEAAIEAANELLRQQPAEAEIEKRCTLIAERILDELRRKIDLATKSGGPNIVSLNLRTQHLEELQSIVSAAEIDNVNAMTIANMRSLDVTAIEAMACVLSRRHANVAGFSGEVRPGSPLPLVARATTLITDTLLQLLILLARPHFLAHGGTLWNAETFLRQGNER